MLHPSTSLTLLQIIRISISAFFIALSSTFVIAQDEKSTNQSGEIDEIVVTGVKASLLDAINKKRNAQDIRDIINAEDIGKLPDRNVAEALQRITGVQIGRDFGEGEEIAVRGIANVRVELNGTTQIGSDVTANSRGVTNFSMLPAEMFSSLEVIKSPSADETEGGLGAIVRLNTRKPLDSGPKRYISFNLNNVYGARSDQNVPAGSLYFKAPHVQFGNDNRFGAIFNFAHSARKARQDSMFVRGWQANNSGGTAGLHGDTNGLTAFAYDLDGNGVAGEPMVIEEATGKILELNDAIWRPRNIQTFLRDQDRETDTAKATFQLQTGDGSEFILDLSHSESTRYDIGYQHSVQLNGRQLTRDFRPADGATNFLDALTPNQTLMTAIVGNVRANRTNDRGAGIFVQPRRQPFEGDSSSVHFTFEKQIRDRLIMKAQVQVQEADEVQDQLYAGASYAFGSLPFTRFDFANGKDVLDVTNHVRTSDPLTEENRVDALDPSQFRMGGINYQPQYSNQTAQEFKLDFDYEVDWGNINMLEFGVRIASREGSRSRTRSRDTWNNRNDAPTNDADGILAGKFWTHPSQTSIDELLCPTGAWSADTRVCSESRIIVFPYDDVLEGASGNYDVSYVTIDAEWIMSMGDEMKTIGGTPLTLDPGWAFDVEEDTSAVYFKANFDGVSPNGLAFIGNFGLRYVETEQYAAGVTETGSAGLLLADRPTEYVYRNVLPSMNITFPLLDNKLLLRLAAGKAMGRPQMFNLAPIGNLRFYEQAGDLGNPYLKAEVVSSVDASLEYYTENGGLFSAAIFHKSYKDAIELAFETQCWGVKSGEGDSIDDGLYANATDCPGTYPNYVRAAANGESEQFAVANYQESAVPNRTLEDGSTNAAWNPVIKYQMETNANVGDSTVQGIELAVNQPLDNLPAPWSNFIIQANYSFTDSSLFNESNTGFPIGMVDFSENSYNAILMYENGPLSARMAYNWREAYFDETTQAGGARISKDYGQLDGSLAYKLDDLGLKNYTLSLGVINLLDKPREWYQEIEERFIRYEVNDTVWTLTLRGSI